MTCGHFFRTKWGAYMAVNKDRQEVTELLRWVEAQGVTFWSGAKEWEIVKPLFRSVAEVFPELTGKLNALYLFSQEEQTGEECELDGTLWWKETPRGMRFVMGLAIEALQLGEKYVIGLILHELAHLTNGSHDEQNFYRYLDELARQYREATGQSVFPDRHDFEPDAPPGGPGRPRKQAYPIPAGHSAAAARRKMVNRHHRKATRGFGMQE